MWVCGPSAFNNCTTIVRKPTILWVCGPRARLRVALGLALVQSDRVSNPQFIGFQPQFRRFARPQGMASNPQFTKFGARFSYFPKKPTRYPLRMCKTLEAAGSKIENLEKWFEQRTRAQNSENCGFKAKIAQICFCVDMSRNPQFIGFGAQFVRSVPFFLVAQAKSSLSRTLLPAGRTKIEHIAIAIASGLARK